MADPFALINRSMNRSAASTSKGNSSTNGATRTRKKLDPSNPKDLEYLRRMHPDFDEFMVSSSVDYKTRCQTEASFADRFKIPPVVEPKCKYREHQNSVDAVCWSPDPDLFISASHDSTLKVWDARKGVCTDTLSGHVAGVYHCAVADSRQLVVSCGSGEERNVLLWRWPEKKVCSVLTGHGRSAIHACFSSDSCLAATT